MRRITIAGISALVLIGGALLWAWGRTRAPVRGLETADGRQAPQHEDAARMLALPTPGRTD
jgi:hypothetical protein